MQDKINAIVETIKELSEDRRIPRNIREKLDEVRRILLDSEDDLAVRIHKAVTELDSITEDPNLPIYARTQIWFLITLLESLQG